MVKNDIVPELSKVEFDNFVKEGVVFVDFYADWCMPCMMMSPIIDDLSEKFKGKIKFGKVYVGESQDLAQKFGVSSIPHLMVFKDGKKIEEYIKTGKMKGYEILKKQVPAFIILITILFGVQNTVNLY